MIESTSVKIIKKEETFLNKRMDTSDVSVFLKSEWKNMLYTDRQWMIDHSQNSDEEEYQEV